MALTLSGTNGVVGAGFTLDASGASVTAGVGTFGSVSIPDSIIHVGDTNTKIRFPAADTITAETGGSERVRIDSAGRLGIGENSPSAQLHVSTPASTTCEIRLTANNTGSGAGDRGRINVYSSLNDGTAYQAGMVDIDRSSGTDDIAHLLVSLNDGSSVAERLRITGGGDLKFNSGFGSVTTVYGCRAWIQLNQAGGQSITGSGGVSSITDEGTGTTKITFTTAMPDDNWAMVGGAQQSGQANVNYGFSLCMQSYTTTYGILIYRPSASSDVKEDNSKIHVAFFR